jgi:hypothetical protein
VDFPSSTLEGIETRSEGRLSLRHATIARAGLDVPWQVTLVRNGGFEKEVTLAVIGDYFDIYETQSFTPEPGGTRRHAERPRQRVPGGLSPLRHGAAAMNLLGRSPTWRS